MIRPYSPPDKEALLQILRQNTPQYFHVTEEEDFISYLDNHAQNYYVVLEDDTIIGAGGINYLGDNKLARISWDMIHPAYQGQGIGKKLTQFRLNEIKKTPVVLVVVRTTQLVYPFYEKLGFALERTQKDFWAKGFDLYQMKLELNKNDGQDGY